MYFCAQMISSAHMFEDRRIPLLYVYSSADECIDSELNAEFADLFGARSNSTDVYNADCQPTSLCPKAGNLLSHKFP